MATGPRSGRPKKTTPRSDRELCLNSRRNRWKTAPELRQDCNLLNVHVSTVKRRLCDRGLNGRIARRKPKLTADHKRRRLEFARAHVNWTREQWSQVLWSDESRFVLYQNDKRRQYVRRLVGEEYHEQCVQPTVKHGGTGIMVWGCMSRAGLGQCVRVEGNINQFVYLDILEDVMLPSAHYLIGPDFMFQHDNAPSHTARTVRNWLANPAPDALVEDGVDWNIDVIDWPAQSPDLNPIEHLWDHIEREISRVEAPRGGLNGLFARVQEIWDEIDLEVVEKLVDSMPERCQAVINNRGSYTRF